MRDLNTGLPVLYSWQFCGARLLIPSARVRGVSGHTRVTRRGVRPRGHRRDHTSLVMTDVHHRVAFTATLLRI